MVKKANKLERIAEKAACAVIGAEYVLVCNNYDGLHASGLEMEDRFRWLPIEQSYFGDAPEMFVAIVASGFAGDKIRTYGQEKGRKGIEFLGKHFSKLSAAAIGAYYTLGETILPQLLPGTEDVNDVPAVIITALASPFVAKFLVRKWNGGLREKFYDLFRKPMEEAA